MKDLQLYASICALHHVGGSGPAFVSSWRRAGVKDLQLLANLRAWQHWDANELRQQQAHVFEELG